MRLNTRRLVRQNLRRINHLYQQADLAPGMVAVLYFNGFPNFYSHSRISMIYILAHNPSPVLAQRAGFCTR